MRIRELLECCLYVDDLDQAARFYADVLGFELVDRQEGRHVFFRCGQRMLLIFDPRGSDDPDSELPRHGTQGVGHVAFAAANDELPAWQTHLEQHGVRIVHTIDWPQGGRSIYFDDPAGNSLEIASPRIWQIDESRCMEGPTGSS